MEQTQIDNLFSQLHKKDERIKELESALILMKKAFDASIVTCAKLIDGIEKDGVLTFNNETGELIRKKE
jgi:hypothetical protein